MAPASPRTGSPHPASAWRTGTALFVAWFSRQPVTAQKTYGYLRWEIHHITLQLERREMFDKEIHLHPW